MLARTLVFMTLALLGLTSTVTAVEEEQKMWGKFPLASAADIVAAPNMEGFVINLRLTTEHLLKNGVAALDLTKGATTNMLLDSVETGLESGFFNEDTTLKCGIASSCSDDENICIGQRILNIACGATTPSTGLTRASLSMVFMSFTMAKDVILDALKIAFEADYDNNDLPQMVDLNVATPPPVPAADLKDGQFVLKTGSVKSKIKMICAQHPKNISKEMRKKTIIAICKWVGFTSDDPCSVELSAGVCPAGRRLLSRSLLAGDFELTAEFNGLTESQGALVSANIANDGGGSALNKELTDSGVCAEGTTCSSGATAPEAKGIEFFTPTPYVPSASVVTVHGKTRYYGPADPKFTLEADELMPWVIGVATTAGLVLLMCVFIWFLGCAYCCCPCCCCKDKGDALFAKDPKCCGSPLPAKWTQLLVMVVCFIVLIVGMSMAMDGKAAFVQTFTDMDASFKMVDKELSDVKEAMTTAKTAVAEIIKSLQKPADQAGECSAAIGFLTAMEAAEEGVAQDIPDMGDLSSMSKSLSDLSGMMAMMVDLLVIVPFLMAGNFLLAVAYTWLVLDKKSMAGAGTKKTKCGCWEVQDDVISKIMCCTSCFSAFGVPWLMFITFFLSVIFTILAVVFSDLCITDPIDAIIVALGDGLADFAYLINCKGSPPAFLLSIHDMLGMMLKVVASAEGMIPLFNLQGGDCQYLGYKTDKVTPTASAAAMLAGFNDFGAVLDTIGSKLSCELMYGILSSILHKMICSSLVDATYFTSEGFTLMAFPLIIMWFQWGTVDKRQRAKLMAIVPLSMAEEGKGGNFEEATQMIEKTTIDVAGAKDQEPEVPQMVENTGGNEAAAETTEEVAVAATTEEAEKPEEKPEEVPAAPVEEKPEEAAPATEEAPPAPTPEEPAAPATEEAPPAPTPEEPAAPAPAPEEPAAPAPAPEEPAAPAPAPEEPAAPASEGDLPPVSGALPPI